MTRVVAAALLCLVLVHPGAAQGPPDDPVQIMLFSDASWAWTDESTPGFSLGQVVGHLNAVLTPRLSAAAEATLTSRADGTVATLERLVLRYDFSDRFKISGGRYHTPISWWNTQYHHGLWLQTSIDRPRTIRFGTPLVPVHFLGLLAEGTLPAGDFTVLYEAGAGNGRQPEISLPGDAGDANSRPAFVGGLRLRPLALPGVELGLHAYLDEVPAEVGAVDERILGAHAVWLSNPEIIAEYLSILHEPEQAGAESTSTDAYYAQVAWRPGPAPMLQPYVRFERIDVPAGDPLFADLGLDYEGLIGGVRWDFVDFAALKAELRSEAFDGADRLISLVLNAAFVIPNIFG